MPGDDSPQPPGAPDRSAAAERRRLVLSARDGWKRQLMDLSRRNNLLFFRELQSGTLGLDGLAFQARQGLIAGEQIAPLEAFPQEDRPRLARNLRDIWRKSRSNKEEKGLETLFLGMGLASWKPQDEGRPPQSPVILLPVELTYRGTDPRNVTLMRSGDLQLNPALVQVLKTDHGCMIDEQAFIAGFEAEGGQLNLEAAFSSLRRLAGAVPEFSIGEKLVLGNFSFQRMAMVRDIVDFEGALVANDLVAAIAGDAGARAAIQGTRTSMDPRELDAIPPDDEWLILKSDSSQRAAIEAAKKGSHLVIQGPPGTGKSQTISNLICALAADGKRVLFVAEKRAALDVVLARLRDAGLEHIVLDLHGADVSKREIIDGLKLSLDTVRNSTEVECDECHRRFAQRRDALNGHDRDIHLPREPSGLSVYEMEGRLLAMPPETRSPLRWRGPQLQLLVPPNVDRASDLLAQMGGFQDLLFKTAPSPWINARFGSGEEANRMLDVASRLAGANFQKYCAQSMNMLVSCGFPAPATVAETRDGLALIKRTADVLFQMDPRIFDMHPGWMASVLEPGMGGLLRELRCKLFRPDFRRARQTMLSLQRAGAGTTMELHHNAAMAAEVLDRWKALALDKSSMPRVPPGFDGLGALQALVVKDLDGIAGALGRDNLAFMELGQLGRLLACLSSDRQTPVRLAALRSITDGLDGLGATRVVEHIVAASPPPANWPLIYKRAWLESCLEQIMANVPAIPGFNGRSHDAQVADFWKLDDERLLLARSRIRRRHGQHVIDVMNRLPDQAATVRRETEKRSRHKTLRALMVEAPDVLMAICPCWMASPLSVSQLLDAKDVFFDYVIFDEASQVLPETAIPAIMRGRRVIMAGDGHQLPPTVFFTIAEDEESDYEPSSTAGFQSVLDLMNAFVDSRSLDWHYRSRDETLIAFSNRNIYNGRLVTFPGTGRQSTLTHVLVETAPSDGDIESPSEEVRRVVELVLEHARCRPLESLGVITMGIKHAKRIQAALDNELDRGVQNPDFFDTEKRESFFIKNLERVQGDERDAVILSVGYGKRGGGRLHYLFGPLLQDGGERRLNVAITRARRRMTVVSSFTHLDMDPERSESEGVRLLRGYLQYAASQGKESGEQKSRGTLNSFEADVFDNLTASGMPLEPQWGSSGYRIDMAARHPSKPGRFVLAIECDGASYHSVPMARDRDRLRQEQLEALGWKFLRIWSQDWFMRKEEEIKRAQDAYKKAVELADAQDAADSAGLSGPGMAQNPGPDAHASCELRTRGPRPQIPAADSIDGYGQEQIRAVIEWIMSDGKLRTDGEILEEASSELGFSRMGTKIEAALKNELDAIKAGKR